MVVLKPLNKVAKRKAIKRFAGIYGLLLLTVLLISYFLFSSPVKILKHDVKNYSALKMRHDSLMKKLNSISRKAAHLPLAGTDNNNPAAARDSIDSEYKVEIKKFLEDLRSNGEKEAIPEVKEDINNYITAYKAVLYYFEMKNEATTDKKNNTIIAYPAKTVNKTESDNINTLTAEISNLNAEKIKLANENKRLLTLMSEGTKESIDKNWQAKIAETEKERDMYKNQATTRSEDIRTKDGIIKDLRKEKEDLVAEANKKSAAVNSEEKSQLYQVVDKVIRKSKHSKKEVFADFNNILRSMESTYPQKALLDKKINEINKLMSGDF